APADGSQVIEPRRHLLGDERLSGSDFRFDARRSVTRVRFDFDWRSPIQTSRLGRRIPVGPLHVETVFGVVTRRRGIPPVPELGPIFPPDLEVDVERER